MQTVILVIHIILGLALVGVVLMQRSEGGALGIGGGGGGGGLMSGRGAAGAMVRTTIIVGGLFIVTSLTLTTIAARTGDRTSIAEERVAPLDQGDGAAIDGDITGPLDIRGALNLGGDEPDAVDAAAAPEAENTTTDAPLPQDGE